jgi:hypothetical protein
MYVDAHCLARSLAAYISNLFWVSAQHWRNKKEAEEEAAQRQNRETTRTEAKLKLAKQIEDDNQAEEK